MSNNNVSGALGCGLKAPRTAPAATRQAPTTPRKSTHSLSGGRPQHDFGALPSPSEHAYAAPLPDLRKYSHKLDTDVWFFNINIANRLSYWFKKYKN